MFITNKKPHLFVICGYIGVGKTTTAKILSKLTGAQRASVDETINTLITKPSNRNKDAIFNPEELKICYNAFALISKYLLSSGISVIIDGGFAKKLQRKQVIAVAKKLKVPFHVIHVTCPEKIIKIRASKRFKDGKGVGWKGFLQLKKIYEPLSKPFYTVDTSKNVNKQLLDILNLIQ